MDEITLKNFRCFREEQTACLAPLTLLVGENSTGKTSFMAMIRALWDVTYRRTDPDFKEEPTTSAASTKSPTTEGDGVAGLKPSRRDFSASRRRETRTDRTLKVATDRPYRFDVQFGEMVPRRFQ